MPGTKKGADMTTLIATPARLSVAEYQRLVEVGGFDGKRVELLDGIVVTMMPINPPHGYSVSRLNNLLHRLLPGGWFHRIQTDVALSRSQPVPDVSIARGDDSQYRLRHPSPPQIGILIEVSDSTLDADRHKREIYARDSIPVYWIINLVNRQVEVYTQPSGPTATPGYAHQDTYTPGITVPVVLDGVTVGQLAVDDLLP